MPFISLGLLPALARAAAERGYSVPTPIQTQAVPAILAGRDVRGMAQTGSGKTAAYALPVLQALSSGAQESPRRVRALILVPTRELAAQVGESLRSLAQHLPRPPKIAVAFGGVSINPQMMALRGGADVMVATPGRLLDLIGHNALRLSSVAMLVLDEADRLLDLGFAEELARLVDLLPQPRQNLLFSATFPAAIETLADALLRDPVRIEIASEPATEPAISQRAIEVDDRRRTQLLARLIKDSGWTRVLVFVATKYAAEIVADKLRKAGIEAEPFHGVLSQGKRTQVLEDFKASRVKVVVATDLAARGLDVVQLPVVVNYDLPRSSVDYVHRIGRTGRAGQSGVALSFITADMDAHFALIERRQGLNVPRERVAGFEPMEARTPAAAPVPGADNGGVKGKRPSKKDKLRAATRRDE
ncbi:DEAD/DEAH box helicase [Variovorax ginsengisoli]|uniref:Superfamily II DNA/RNA helicase n=1 Tax=Variovorax ginsengisoli TaxID=363844 RepID=A0ABT9SCH2_9BURK|nr:DEAD/DEAH box helicase [Variovorax ginsengisoli]MDP9902048.1 superfamily II DNA/RNA helicase [Variovorax ginsengisoli]